MNNAELIDSLRYCLSDDYVKRGCCKCPINKDGMVCGTQDDAIKYAADALEEAEKRIAELMPKEGAWIDLFGHDYKCSVCGEWYKMDGTPETEDMNYCPNCGAKMKGDEK